MRIEAWKSQDFNGLWTRDVAIPVRCSNQLNYEATDVGSRSFVSSNEPVKNGCEAIYEMFHILNCGFWNQVSYDHRSYERNLSNCWKSQDFNGVWNLPLKSWLFQASIRNCLNCIHNCDDHSLLDFKICSSIYETLIFIHHFSLIFAVQIENCNPVFSLSPYHSQ